jgi:iron(III) transport system substrate-binding protein
MKFHSIVCGAFLAVGLVTHANAQDSKIIEGAKAEGRVVWYSGSNLGTAQAVANAFEKQYPFMKVDLIRSSDEQMLNRITTEKQAGKILFDVVNSQIIAMIDRLNILKPISMAAMQGLDAKYKDPKGRWAGVHVNYYALSYNSNMVGKDQAPRDWPDLLDPKWQGKIGMDPEEFDWLGAMMGSLGEEKAKKLMRGLAKQDIQWHKGHTQVAQLMAAGEYPLGLTYAHRIEALKKKGAPLDWVRTTKPIVVNFSKVGVSTTGPHPHGAVLLTEFLISEKGQKAVYKAGSVPVYPGIVPKDSPLDPAGLDLYPVSSEVTVNLNRYVKEFESLFGPRR